MHSKRNGGPNLRRGRRDDLVYRLTYLGDVVAFKMGRRQGGPRRTGGRRASSIVMPDQHRNHDAISLAPTGHTVCASSGNDPMKAAADITPKVQENRSAGSAKNIILGSNSHDQSPIGDTKTVASSLCSPLNLVDQEFAISATDVIKFLSDFLSRLPKTQISYPAEKNGLVSDYALRRNPPEDGLPLPEVLRIISDAAEPRINTVGGGFMAYVPGGGLVTAAIADLIAGVMNPYTGVGAGAPALVALEVNVLHWLAKLVGLPSTAFWILTSGASLATLSAFLCARTAHIPEDFRFGTVYATDQTANGGEASEGSNRLRSSGRPAAILCRRKRWIDQHRYGRSTGGNRRNCSTRKPVVSR